MEATKKVVSQIETILCQRMAEATGKPAQEFSLSVEEREKMKEAVDDMVNEYLIDQEEQGKIRSEIDLTNRILTDWFDEDKEKRAVLTMIIDQNDTTIKGVFCGKSSMLINGLINLMKNNDSLAQVITDASSFFLIGEIKDGLKELLSKNDEDHGNAEQQQQ